MTDALPQVLIHCCDGSQLLERSAFAFFLFLFWRRVVMNAGSESVPLKCAIGTHRRKNAIDAPRVLVVDDFFDTADAISMVLDLIGLDNF